MCVDKQIFSTINHLWYVCFTQTANLSGVLVDSLPNVAVYTMTMVLIESGQEDCTVTIGYLSHATRGMSHNERQRALRTRSTHRHPIVLEEHLITHWKEGEGH